YVLLVAGAIVVGFTLGPRVGTEVRGLAERVPEIARQLSSGTIVSETLQRHGWGADLTQHLEATMRTHASEIVSAAQSATVAALKWLTGAWVIVLVPIFAFFLLKDGDRFMTRTAELLDR